MRAPTYLRGVFDGVEVRATKGEAPRPARAFPTTQAYPLEVDGVIRGTLVYQRAGMFNRGHTGWVVLSLMPWTRAERDSRPCTVATTYSSKPGLVDSLFSRVPGWVAGGKMPTQEEVDAAIEVAAAEHDRYLAQKVIDDAERERRRLEGNRRMAERSQAYADGLQSLFKRADLTNLERVAVIEAMDRIALKPEEDA